MRERPILFSDAMVRAILQGDKTVTRREVVSRSRKRPFMVMADNHPDFPGRLQPFQADEHGCISFEEKGPCEFPIVCPYGQVGDRLWIRETWADVNCYGAPGIAYRADDDVRDLMADKSFLEDGGAFNYDDPRVKPYAFCCWFDDLAAGVEGRWRPSIHMPRWASRILLEIADVRIERLHDITPEQALAEGVASCQADLDPDGNDYSPCELFSILWVSLNGHDSWHANPWLWVVEFKVVTDE